MNPALESLFVALDHEPSLDSGGPVAFLRAHAHQELSRFSGRLQCAQDFKPRALALERSGITLAEKLEGPFSLVLVMPERQKEMTLADLARAHDLLAEGGMLLCSLPNDWGAKRFEQRLKEVAGTVGTLSKNRCRTFWARKTPEWNQEMLAEWRAGGEFRKVADDRFWSVPGLFAWDRIDVGSRLLSENLPADISGQVADLGVGWGFLSDFVLRNRPGVTELDVYDADGRAIEAAKMNLAGLNPRARVRYYWHNVTTGLCRKGYDWIISNPPFHETRQPDPVIGMRFLVAAALALKPDGKLWIVANKHLPYEKLMREGFAETSVFLQQDGYKILMGSNPNPVIEMPERKKR